MSKNKGKELLRRAIDEKWIPIAKGKDCDEGPSICALCMEFRDAGQMICKGCPVSHYSGDMLCRVKECRAWVSYMVEHRRDGEGDPWEVFDEQSYRLACDFIRYLERVYESL